MTSKHRGYLVGYIQVSTLDQNTVRQGGAGIKRALISALMVGGVFVEAMLAGKFWHWVFQNPPGREKRPLQVLL